MAKRGGGGPSSSVVPSIPTGGAIGRYDMEFLYRLIHDHTDRTGAMIPNQREFAVIADIPYQQICTFIKQYIQAGYMKRLGNYDRTSKFVVLYHPDDCDWDSFYELIPTSDQRRRNG